MAININSRRILARPRTKRYDYYVYGDAMSSTSSVVNSNTGSSSGGGSNYISLDGEDIEGSDYTYSKGRFFFNPDMEFGVGVNANTNGMLITGPVEFGEENDTVTVKGGFVATDSGGILQRLSMGWGTNPGALLNSFSVSSGLIQYKGNNVFHAADHMIPVSNGSFNIGDTNNRWNNVYGSYFTGNSATANKWLNPITLSLTGAIKGSVSFDGSQNVSMTTSLDSLFSVTLWGQTFNGTQNVSGFLSSANGMSPSTTELYDIGGPTMRYKDYYGRRVFLGVNNYGEVDNGTEGLSLVGYQCSLYAFGLKDASTGRQGFCLTSTWRGNGYDAGLINGAERYWMMYEKLYVGGKSATGHYDSAAATLNEHACTIYGATIACQTLKATSKVTAPSVEETSDRRLKSNIKQIEKVDFSHLSTYRYTIKVEKETGEKEEIPKIGVIAQEVQECYPELVSQNGEYLSVNYNGLTALLIEKVKQLEQRIVELETKE